MEKISHNVELTTAEIANLWTQYMNDSLSICILTHSIKHAKDQDIKKILEFSLSLAESHIVKIREIFNQNNFPIPKGFSIEEDVNLSAPALFTDSFMINYLHIMTLLGLTGYAGAVATSSRKDQLDYFIQCNMETMELHKRTINVMLNKGLYSKTARINPPSKVDFVHNQSYLNGWFGKKRPLNIIEISGMSFNMKKDVSKAVLELAFGQVCQTKEIQKYFERGKNICKSHFTTFNSILTKEELSSPKTWVSEVTNSTVSPYSEKLMLYHVVTLVSAAIGYYGAGLSVSQRRDLSLEYTKFITEVSLFVEDGAQLLIKYGWLEQPPLSDNRKDLAKEGNNETI
ncbi:DUF3231 family protein [Caldibacillus lycopersici]|uniref:DUF3231 family protein n=1 Tax=Perspicuibacillus lycopersici TaxID=1325689 RepID=A0AAE3IUN7_9BACI|nr:DUF3231 family protein [Perspicuibacillus lycopersici]MCU9614522.1 DUF3231 family protein [Perspicuibacillus lycopersici]